MYYFLTGGLLYVELAELLFCIWRPLISSKDKSISGALCGALHITLPVSLCSFPAALLHCLPLPAYTYSTKTACHSKCTNVDSYFIVVCRLRRAFLLLSIPSFRTPLHPGAFKTANNHPVPCTSTVWGWFWYIEYQTEIKSSQTASSLWLQSWGRSRAEKKSCSISPQCALCERLWDQTEWNISPG